MKENQTFRTEIKSTLKENSIDHKSSILLIGSCFSENIGKKLNYFGFDAITNPYGILFNPIAIQNSIEECLSKKKYTKKDLFFFNEQYHNYNFHSVFSDTNPDLLLEKINATIEQTHFKLKKATHIIITLGSAFAYRLLETDAIVANCHKVPQKKFSKKILSVQEISTSLKKIISSIKNNNKNAKILFTISPIRHLKDGIAENSRSKANLIAATYDALENNCFYFPSFEIMNDDLRDYRFYESDMIHPNQTAIDYIWTIFKNEWLADKTSQIMKEVETIRRGKQHRAFNPNSEKHKKFLSILKSKEENLRVHHNIILTGS